MLHLTTTSTDPVSCSKSRVDLVKLQRGSQLDLDQRIVLENAHGEEVVRSIFPDQAVCKAFSLLRSLADHALEWSHLHCR